MKKILCIIVGCIIPFLLVADIAPSDQHLVDNTIKFTNLDDFSEISILGYIVGPSYDSPIFLLLRTTKFCRRVINLTIWDYIGHQQNMLIL